MAEGHREQTRVYGGTTEGKERGGKGKGRCIDELYDRLDTVEGEKDLHRLVRQRNEVGKGVQHVRVIMDAKWKFIDKGGECDEKMEEYVEELMNGENETERWLDVVPRVNQKVGRITMEEVKMAIKKMKNGKAVGPDDIPLEAWRYLGEMAVRFLSSLVIGCYLERGC